MFLYPNITEGRQLPNSCVSDNWEMKNFDQLIHRYDEILSFRLILTLREVAIMIRC